ncbi:hypothetical protein QTP70_011160 [Hemibagrus guttatus]|uniref:ribonuclease H n=1 Tax=Hemibagrus guttatus TaxID=175788 RepID=A0AAE0UL27_9TELE|nr:hypothetical protein QTP70_011160 [Hemibagrus guttatus]
MSTGTGSKFRHPCVPEPGVTVEDVLEETGKFISYDNLVSASRVNKAVVFVKKEDLVKDLTSVGISERRSCYRSAAYSSDNQSHYFKRPAIPTISYRGRVLVINNLAASSSWHKVMVMDPPNELIHRIQQAIVDFFWCGKHWLKAATLSLLKEEGGQGLVHIRSQIRAFRLQSAQRLVYHKDLAWTQTACLILQRAGHLGLDKHLLLLKDAYGWKPDEDLKVMTGLRGTLLISKMKKELLLSYRVATDGGGTNQDFPKIMIIPAISKEQQEELSGSNLTFKTPNLGDFQLVGCELEEKERFWSELDEVMESIPTGERVVIGADFNGHVGEGNTGDEEVMGKFGVKERNLEGQMVVDFAKRMDMAVVNTYFQKREEHRVTYKSGGRRTQVDYILCRRGNLKEISDCKVVVGESVARQHRMVVCRMTLMVCNTKRSKIEIEKKTKWWKLKKEECCEEFRQKLRQALGGQVVLPDDWETTAEVIRETGRKVLGVSSGRRKEDKETWWWNEEVQDSIQRKRLARKKWDMDRTEENRQEYKELQRRVKREVSKAKQKAYDELYTRLDTREGEKDLYRLARQRDRDGKDVQQVRVIKDRDGRVLTSEESVQRRWKEYFEELMNEENEREKRVEGVNSVEQKVDKIRKDEVRKALKRMKSGKAVGPDDIPAEVWKCLGEAAVEFLTSLFNRVLESERMPEEWRRSVLVPIFKNKGDVQSCSNYRGIKLMSHTMKLWERVVEARLRKVVEICEQQYGFMPRKNTTDAIFALRILIEKYRDGQRELHCVFVDLEKAYDRVPREELWYCMRKSGVAEKYVRVVQDMYERSRTVVRCAVGQTEEFKVEVGLNQGSALSPFLFAIVMDQLSEEVRQESPWTMMFADDIVICSESREQVEENLERWRFALERRGMKVSGSKTEYMCVNEREGSGTVRLQGEEMKKVQEFKYLGSTVQSNRECGKEVKKRVQAGWNGWRKVWGVLCERKISARIKGKVYRTVVRAAMLYGLETVSLRKRQESELEVAELKMLRFSLGVTRLDRIRNEYIRGTAHVGRLGDKVREARLRWFGHVQRRESEYIGRRMLDMELPGRRQRGRPKRRVYPALMPYDA